MTHSIVFPAPQCNVTLVNDGALTSWQQYPQRPGRGFFGIGIWHPKTDANVGTLWRSAHLYGASFLFTVGPRYRKQPTDTTKAMRHVPLISYVNIDDLIEHLPCGAPLIGIELHERARMLHDYTHPRNAVYLLGAEDHGLPPDVLRRCHSIVQVPTAMPHSLNVATAGSIVLYDRFAKAVR